MKLGRPARTPPDPREAAIEWLARERDGRLPPDQQPAFEAWLAADPEHAAIYERARAAVAAPSRHSADPQIMRMRSEALAVLERGRRRGRYVAAAAAAAVVAVIGGGLVGLIPDTSPRVSPLEQVAAPLAPALNPNAAIYRTAVGERTTVTLPDGSVATLNTDSVVKIAYTSRERGVRLVQGQAMFEVAKNPEVPFQVYAGDRRVTAVGTTFDVRLDQGRVKVTLVEGVVRVAHVAPKAPTAPKEEVTMAAGEALVAGPATPMTVRTEDVAAETSWEAGVVVFKATTLAEAVAEVNRYSRRQIALTDPAIGAWRVTGVFRTGDPESFARSVEEILPVRVEAGDDGSLTMRRENSAAG